jgi:Domain of unknown function (DUF4178)
VTPDSRRALGYGLLAAAIGIAVLMLLWIVTSGAQAGGIVLGLLLTFVLAAPLAAVGAYILSRARAEVAAELAFSGKQRILDADRLFRHELAARLRQLADLPNLPSQRMRDLAQTAERTVGDEAAWYAAVQLTDSQIAVLEQYDDLVWERVRWLRAHADEPPESIAGAVEQLQRAMDERTDLLVRARQAPPVAPAELLAGSTPSVPSLGVGDAVSRDGVDYLVEAVASSFADGQTWKLAHLVPSGAEGSEHWLETSPGGLEMAWLDTTAAPAAAGAPQLASLPLVSSGSATVTVTTGAGKQTSVLVEHWRYRGPTGAGLVQKWPDGALQAYVGTLIRPRDVQVWPSSSRTAV